MVFALPLLFGVGHIEVEPLGAGADGERQDVVAHVIGQQALVGHAAVAQRRSPFGLLAVIAGVGQVGTQVDSLGIVSALEEDGGGGKGGDRRLLDGVELRVESLLEAPGPFTTFVDQLREIRVGADEFVGVVAEDMSFQILSGADAVEYA